MKILSKYNLSEEILQTLMITSRLIESSIRRQQNELLPPHILILGRAFQGPVPQKEISQHLQIGASTVSATIDVLTKRGLIIRERSSQDRRITLIKITQQGKNLFFETFKNLLSEMQTALDGLSEEQLETVSDGIAILRNAMLQNNTTELPEHFLGNPLQFLEDKGK